MQPWLQSLCGLLAASALPVVPLFCENDPDEQAAGATGPVCVGWDDAWVVYHYSPSKGSWSIHRAPPTERPPTGLGTYPVYSSRAVAIVTPKWKFSGWLFDLQHRKWTAIPPSPAGAVRLTGGAVGDFADDRLIVWGLTGESPHGAVLDLRAMKWQPLPDAPVSCRDGCAHTMIGNKFLFWGGFGSGYDPTDAGIIGPVKSGAVYDLTTDSWEKMPDPPVDFGNRMAWGTWRNRFVLFGGSGSRSGALYDPATRQWEKMTEAPFEVAHLAAHTIVGDRLFLWSGRTQVDANDPKNPGAKRTVYPRDGAVYDLVTKEWRKVPQAPIEGRFQAFAHALGTDKVIVWGGRSYPPPIPRAKPGGPVFHRSGAIFDLQTGRWEKIPDLPADIPMGISLGGG